MLYMLISGGNAHPEKKDQRLPPMKHTSLRRALKEAKNEDPAWAKPEVGGLELIDDLTSEKATLRKTSPEVGRHRFFTQLLGDSIECLLPMSWSPSNKMVGSSSAKMSAASSARMQSASSNLSAVSESSAQE